MPEFPKDSEDPKVLTESSLRYVRGTLGKMIQPIDECLLNLMNVYAENVDREVELATNDIISAANSNMSSVFRKWCEHRLNIHLLNMLDKMPDDDLGRKRYLAAALNLEARKNGFAFLGDDLEAKIIIVAGSRDGKGRYAFEDRKTKKRKGSHASLRDIWPLQLTIDPPRDVHKEMFDLLAEERERGES